MGICNFHYSYHHSVYQCDLVGTISFSKCSLAVDGIGVIPRGAHFSRTKNIFVINYAYKGNELVPPPPPPPHFEAPSHAYG